MPVSRFHELLYKRDGSDRCRPQTVAEMTAAPKFVFTLAIRRFIDDNKAEYVEAIIAAAEAGHTELPVNPMLVETENSDGGRSFWLLRHAGPRSYRAWMGMMRGDFAVILPGSFTLHIDRSGLPQYDGYASEVPLGVDEWDENEELYKLKVNCMYALFHAMALHIRGIVTRPPLLDSPKLDKARLKRGLPPITKDYVTVHIGYVTDRDGKRHDVVTGRHVRMHLRRGHRRNQPCGPHLQDRREIWIPATLVNYQPNVPVSQPDYLVVP